MLEQYHEYQNISDKLGYLCVSRRIGKIIALNPEFIDNLGFKEKNLLAFSNTLDIQKNYRVEFPHAFPIKWWKLGNTASLMKNNLLFLHSSNTLVEKELGQGEEIVVRADCIFAFTTKMTFKVIGENVLQRRPPGRVPANFRPFISIKGPGLLYIENVSDSSGALAPRRGEFLAALILGVSIFIIYLSLFILENIIR